MTSKFFGSILLLFLFSIANGQKNYDPSTKIVQSELLEDLSYLKEKLIQGHPGLYWYSSESDVQTAIDQIKQALTSDMTELEFLNLVARLNAVIKCAHSDIRPSTNFNTWWKDAASLIPFNILKVGSAYFIYENLSESKALYNGTKIISINDRPIEAIVANLLPYIPADGNNNTRKYYALRKGFYRYYSYYMALNEQTFKIIYETASGKHSEVLIEGINKTTFNKRRASKATNNPTPITFQILEQHATALLTIPTFRNDLMERQGLVFENFIHASFKELRKTNTQNLIIDLRGNGGGYSQYAVVLYSYLSNSAFQYCKQQTLTSKQLIPEIEYDIPETFGDFPNGIIMENGLYKWPKHSVLGWHEPAEYRFSGKVFFLIDGGCSSTTSELASIAHYNNRGIFVGEEVGGSYLGNSGGILGWFELPNTKIKVRIGLVKYELAVGNSNNKNGVSPDFSVVHTIDTIINGADLEMQLVFDKIKAQQFIKNKMQKKCTQ